MTESSPSHHCGLIVSEVLKILIQLVSPLTNDWNVWELSAYWIISVTTRDSAILSNQVRGVSDRTVIYSLIVWVGYHEVSIRDRDAVVAIGCAEVGSYITRAAY
jgi:hypothetical protein